MPAAYPERQVHWDEVEKESQPQAGQTSHSSPAAPARLLRVLLAEDTRANRKLVAHILGKRGHCIETAEDGQQSLEMVCQKQFDLVLMDVQMPVMDGFQATQAIRALADPKKSHLPILAMTAYDKDGDVERCLRAGMDAYISKPIHGGDLIELVERFAETSSN